MPIVLPPFDPQRAVAEKEPNDKPELATALGDGLAATGSLSAEDRADWFVFDVSGDPQLWSLEASGAGLRHLGIYAVSERKLVERDIRDNPTLRIDTLQLLPARYWLKATPSSAGGDYRLRAVPLGRPERESEFEPNDTSSQAQILRFGEARRGLISHQDDRDTYRFSIDSATTLALELTPPPGLKLVMNIEGESYRVEGDRTAKPGEVSRYAGRLESGDYEVTVRGDTGGTSEVPYQLRIDYRDPFDLPDDLEPNDDPAQAISLERLRRFTGSVGRFRGEDWYRFPAVEVPTTVTVRFEGKVGLNLRRIESGSLKYGKLIEIAAENTTGARSLSATLEPG
ncbi:MAG: hypothetical protein KDI09_14810, partial [Halioglobus sp.]|nr:hypothetical protein [Halioglobus sp.]